MPDPLTNPRLTCPYCGGILKKVPQRKTACPYCDNDIYVKRPPGSQVKANVTKEQADQIDALWEERYEAEDLSREFDFLGITIQQFNEEKKRLQPNGLVTTQMVLISLGQQQILQSRDHSRVDRLFSRMVRWAIEDELPYEPYLQGAAEARLRELAQKLGDDTEIEKRAVPGCCKACESTDRRGLTPANAMSLAPIPCPGCTCDRDSTPPHCQCTYEPCLE